MSQPFFDALSSTQTLPLRRPLLSLRPWAIALGLLILVDVALRLFLPPDQRVLRQPLRAHTCMADAALDALVDLRALGDLSDSAGPALDVVLLGDSVLGSVNNPAGERLHDRLTQRLSQRGLSARVHNLSAGGAHAADQYAALLGLVQRLQPQPMGLQNLVVVLSVNPIFFSRRHSQPPALYPCLFEDLSDDVLGGSATADALRRSLLLPRPAPEYERSAAQLLARTWYLYQQRRRIGEAAFALRDTLREAMAARWHGHTSQHPATVAQRSNQPWFTQGLSAERYATSYEFLAFDDPQAHNLHMTARMASWLAQHPELAVLVEQVPQNHALVGEYTARPAYQAWERHVATLFRAAGLPYVSHDRSAALASEQFQDLDHLTAQGNDTLATLVADDLVTLRLAARTSAAPGSTQSSGSSGLRPAAPY